MKCNVCKDPSYKKGLDKIWDHDLIEEIGKIRKLSGWIKSGFFICPACQRKMPHAIKSKIIMERFTHLEQEVFDMKITLDDILHGLKSLCTLAKSK